MTTKLLYSYPECVLEYRGHLASRSIVGEIWEDVCKISFADFWRSVDLPQLQNIKLQRHELYKVMIFIIMIIDKLDRLQETEKYQQKTSYKENFEK